MNREDAIKILSILKAAYPNSYKGMTKEEAHGTINVWVMQFSDLPLGIVSIAVNKLISTNIFPPSISEVKKKIQSLYGEASEMLLMHRYATKGFRVTNDPDEQPTYVGKALDEQTLKMCEQIVEATEKYRCCENVEPSLESLLSNFPIGLGSTKNENLIGS